MAQVVAHLVAGGHRRIGLITWPEGSKAGSHREQGYADGLHAAGIAPDPVWLFRGENMVQTGAEGLAYLLALPHEQRPTAVACVSDLIAVGVMNAAAAAGLAVGHDLAVTGYDDSALAQFLHPPLTSVRQPIAAVGRHLVAQLLAQIRNEAPDVQGVLLEPELVVRQSSDELRITN